MDYNMTCKWLFLDNFLTPVRLWDLCRYTMDHHMTSCLPMWLYMTFLQAVNDFHFYWGWCEKPKLCYIGHRSQGVMNWYSSVFRVTATQAGLEVSPTSVVQRSFTKGELLSSRKPSQLPWSSDPNLAGMLPVQAGQWPQWSMGKQAQVIVRIKKGFPVQITCWLPEV